MADTFLKIGTRFPQGAFLPDGKPNIPSQAYADYLADNTMTPKADPVGYVAPLPDNMEKPLSNYGFNLAGDYISDAGQSFKNAVTGQGVAQALPEMAFYPGGPKGLQYVYGGIADAGMGALETLMAGLGAGAGFVAEQVPFQNENQEDRLSRDLLGGFEFAEQYLTPYFGLFSKLGRASKVAKAASRAPDLPVAITPDMPIDTPEFGALAAQQQQLNAVDADFIPFEDIRIDTTQPMNIVENTPEAIPQGEILFSPSLIAARELKQEKGSYEQIRAMMINNGAKADELEWSGADNMFSGKKVTKDEIIDYLEKNDPRLIPNIRKADGVLGSEGEAMDMREAVDQVMDDEQYVRGEIDSERELEADFLPQNDYFNPTELGDEELERLAVEMGTDTNDLMGKDWAYRNEDGSVEFFQYDDTALAHQYGGEDELQEELRRKVRLQLEDEYANDPPQFMYQFGVENRNALDAGNTQYSEFFPEGGADYSENLFQYRDPTERIGIDVIAGSNHFGREDAGTIFHTRHADYVDENGDTVRYVGEIQSDPQQKITKSDVITGYSQSLYEEEMQALTYKQKRIVRSGREEQNIAFNMEMDEFELARLGYETNIYNLNNDLKNPNSSTFGDRRIETLASKVEGEIPFSGELTAAQEELLNAYIQQSSNQFRGRPWTRINDAQDQVYEYMTESEVDWLPESTKKRIFDIVDDTANKRQEIENQIIELGKQAYGENIWDMKPGGPFMTSQNKWLDEALRRSIYDAVNDPDVNYLAFPNDPAAIAKVGGRDVAKEGTINYYQRDVQNRLKKLLKSFLKDVNVDTINIGSGEVGSNSYFSSKGFKITPEFREAVLKKGIPTFAVPLAVGTGAGYGALDQVGGGNGQGGS